MTNCKNTQKNAIRKNKLSIIKRFGIKKSYSRIKKIWEFGNIGM